MLPVLHTLTVIVSLNMGRLEKFIREEDRGIFRVPDEAAEASVVAETGLLDIIDHGLDEDHPCHLLQLQDLHELVDGVSGGDEVVGDLCW